MRVKVRRPVRTKKKKRPSYGDHHGGGYDDHHSGGYGDPYHRRKEGSYPLYDDYIEYGDSNEYYEDSYEFKKKSRRKKKHDYVRFASREIERSSPITDSERLFEESYEEHKEVYDDEPWIYKDKTSNERWKRKKKEKQGRHDKRDIFRSWEDNRKAIYQPYLEDYSSTREDSGYGRKYRNFRRRSDRRNPVMWKTSGDLDNSGQYSSMQSIVARGDEKPLVGVGNIPGVEWSLEPSGIQ